LGQSQESSALKALDIGVQKMAKKVTGLRRKLLMTPILVSLAIAPALNTGSSLPNEYKLKQAKDYFEAKAKKEEVFDPFSLKPHYLSKNEIEPYLTKHKKFIPEEFSIEDMKKIINIESSFDRNAYREDYKKKWISKGAYELDTIRQGGLMQVTEDTYKGFEKNIPYYQGVFDADKNIEIGLRNLQIIKNYNVKFNPYWDNSPLDAKQKYIIAGHNWGIGKLRKNEWDLSKAPSITRNFFNKFYSN
jgi:hypothetical protein